MQGAKLRGEPTTISMANLKPICYATRFTLFDWKNWPLYSNRIMQGGMVD